jgi:hypothetical protein
MNDTKDAWIERFRRLAAECHAKVEALNPGRPIKGKGQQGSYESNGGPIEPIFHTEPPSDHPHALDRTS